MNECVCAITGHRPSRFKFKYSEDYALCKKIKASMLEVFRKLHDEKEVRRFYVGGALGVDMWAAEQILRLKEQPGYEDIELVVCYRTFAVCSGCDYREVLQEEKPQCQNRTHPH